MDEKTAGTYFRFFNEIGIIEQLSRAQLEARLPDGMIAPHFTLLNHLIRVKDGQTPLDMARAFQVPKTTLTHTLRVLEKRGFIELRPNPKDARSKQVWLTDAGRNTRDQAIADMVPDFVEMAAEFPPERLEPILPLLEEVRRFLDEARDT